MITGRACSNSYTSKAPLPSMPDEEISASLWPEASHHDQPQGRKGFFFMAIKLSQILNGILNQIYEPWRQNEAIFQDTLNEESIYPQLCSSFMQLDQDLDRFEVGLPEVFQCTTDMPTRNDTSMSRQQKYVLRLRYDTQTFLKGSRFPVGPA